MINQEASTGKITRPNFQNVYQREKFFDILDRCRKKPIIWIYAPPGAGKTTLINSYIESRKLQCLWYQMDSSDKDPATFFHYMGIAAARASTRKEPLPHLTPEYLPGLRTFTREYFSELTKKFKRKSVIVFDNYQEIPIESILHDMVYEGLSNIPKGMSVIIISRTVPPPILSRMRLSQMMEIITYDELRLTSDEVRGIASMRGMDKASDMDIRSMLARTDGWVTGLVLMLESGNIENFSPEPMDSYDFSSTFNYFANEFFQKLSKETQKFLLELSVLPITTSEMARELTGNKQAERIISDLVHRNHFIQSHPGDQVYYQFHPLFREFLYIRLKEGTVPENLTNLELKAARLLADNGHINDAAKLFYNVEDWNSLASLICKEAPMLLEQGRHQVVEGWLNYIPKYVMDEVPWLLFWKGCCLLPFDQTKSRQFFEMSYKTFYNRKDPSGIFLSWSGIILAIIHEFDNLKPLDRWIEVLDDLLAEYRSFPSKEIENRISLSMFLALSFRCPQHPNIGHWVDKAFDILNETYDSNVHTQACLSLVDYFIWTGDLERADVIVGRLSMALGKDLCPPYVLIAARFAGSLNNWYHGNLHDCIMNVSEALTLAESKGVYVFNSFLFGCGAVASLTGGDLKMAEVFLNKATSVLDNNKRLCASYYHHVVACYRLAIKNFAGALEHEQLALSLAVETGSPFAETMSRTGMALLYHELGDQKKAVAEIKNAHEQARSINSKLVEFICYLFEAWFALDRGAKNLATQKLKEAMALGNRQGFVNFHMWQPDMIAQLCVLALEEEIETDYVKRLIRKRDLFPDKAPLEVNNWPWRIKICVLGQFAITKDGIPLQYGKKAPKKPLEMLKLLVLLGGNNVSEEKISDALWQDAEGDAAHVAFKTTLKRLRHLIGVDDAILLHKGSLALNPRYCWVDVWSFNHFVTMAEEYSAEGKDNDSGRLLEKAIAVYGSGLDTMADEEPRTILFYESLRNKFIRCVIKLGLYLEEAEEFEKASECYKKGIEVDMLSEKLYQKLMICLHKHGQQAEALATYKRLAEVYKKVLGTDPSPETKRIYESLPNG